MIIVLAEPRVFLEAGNIVKLRSFRLDNDQVLEQLSALLKRTGKLSQRIISKEKDLPCVGSIVRRFKSLLIVYELIGYKPIRDCGGIASRRQGRIEEQGVNSLGEGMRVAVASGQLPEIFTVTELKTICPGWSAQYYGPLSAHCVARNEGEPLKLKRVGRGRYQIVNLALLQ